MDIQPVQAPVAMEPTHSRRRFIITIIGVLVLIAALIGGYFFLQAKSGGLNGVSIFRGDYITGELHKFNLLGLREKNIAVTGTLSDYAEEGGTKVAIVLAPDERSQDLWLIGGEPRQLTADGIGKAAVSLSPDGKWAAYAQLADAPAGALFNVQLSAWSVRVMNVETGEFWDAGAGFAPQFFVRDDVTYLLFTSARGVVVADATARTTQTTFFLNPGTVDYAAIISEDGSHVAIPNGVNRMYDLFTVTRVAAPLQITFVATAPVLLEGAQFKDDTLYAVEWNESGSYVWKMEANGAAENIYTLPTAGHHRIIR